MSTEINTPDPVSNPMLVPPEPPQVLVDLPEDFTISAAIQVIAKQKGINLARMHQESADGTRFIPIYKTPEELGQRIYEEIIHLYKKNVPIKTIIQRLTQARVQVGLPVLAIMDIYGVLAQALVDGQVTERARQGEYTITAFQVYFDQWRKQTPWAEIKKILSKHTPSEAVFQSVRRSIEGRYQQRGSKSKISPHGMADVPLVEMLRYAEKRMLVPTHDPKSPTMETHLVIPLSRLPLPLRSILRELYCFKGTDSDEFRFEDGVRKELRNVLPRETLEEVRGLLNAQPSTMEKDRWARQQEQDLEAFRSGLNPLAPVKKESPIPTAHDLNSPVHPAIAATAAASEAPPPERGIKIRGGQMKRVYEEAQNGPLPTTPHELNLNAADDLDDILGDLDDLPAEPMPEFPPEISSTLALDEGATDE